mgnify:FL=1
MKKLIALLLAMLCVFALAGCGSTEWTMIDMKGQESQLSAQDAAAVDQCLKGSWEDDTTNCEVVTLKGEGRWVTYCPDCGIFNDLNSGRNLTLSDSAREDMNPRRGQ